MPDEPIAVAFYEISMRCGRQFGIPLPKRLLTLGDPERGWCVRLNATGETIDGVDGFHAEVLWGGFPASIINAYGGVIAAGEAANEDALIAWLKSDEELPCPTN